MTAALTIAEQQQQLDTQCTIKLLTSHSRVLEGMHFQRDAHPILPDVTLDNRKLIERFGHGGRELSGLLAKQCSPLQAKDWLEQQGIVLQEGRESESNLSTLLQETPWYVDPTCDLRRVLEEHLDRAENIHVETNVVITDIGYNDENPGFLIEREENNDLQADVVVLARDYPSNIQKPILVEKSQAGTAKLMKQSLQLNFDDDEEPLSLKDQMKQQKKQQRKAKKQMLQDMVGDSTVGFQELSKQDQNVLARKRSKDKKKKAQQERSAESDATNILMTTDSQQQPDDNPYFSATGNDSVVFNPIDTLGMAVKLGHTIADESPGMFDFLVPAEGILAGCTKAVLPKVRLRCKVELSTEASKKTKPSRLPKVEGPLMMAQGEVSGPCALRLSTLIAHEMAGSKYRGTLQLHFAPDIGSVEEVETMLLDSADPNENVLGFSCPLMHYEIDYDDYDVETGDFKRIAFPLVSDGIWSNLCKEAGIKVSKLKWKDIPSSGLQNLARLLVDSQLTITGVRPHENILAGGVSLKEIEMATCSSRKTQGLFFCGSIIDVHGFDRGFNSLISLATGRVAGMSAIKSLRTQQ